MSSKTSETIGLKAALLCQLNECCNNVTESVKNIRFYPERIDLLLMLKLFKLIFGSIFLGSPYSVVNASGKGENNNDNDNNNNRLPLKAPVIHPI